MASEYRLCIKRGTSARVARYPKRSLQAARDDLEPYLEVLANEGSSPMLLDAWIEEREVTKWQVRPYEPLGIMDPSSRDPDA